MHPSHHAHGGPSVPEHKLMPYQTEPETKGKTQADAREVHQTGAAFSSDVGRGSLHSQIEKDVSPPHKAVGS